MNRYSQRDAVLLEMGFNSYADYLASPLWNRIRARLFSVCSKCFCGADATQFHHRTYKRRYLEGRGKIHKFIVPICRKCHCEIEFAGSDKCSLGQANSKLDSLRMKYEAQGIRMPSRARLVHKKGRRNSGSQAPFAKAELQGTSTLSGKPRTGENVVRTQCHEIR